MQPSHLRSPRNRALWRPGRSPFAGDLRAVLGERGFRRLLATRLVSQTGDGIVTAAIGTYVFFNATTFTSPAAAAAAFSVLYVPYSLIGPFAGVLIDRWSRRQILVVSALLRSVFVVATAAAIASGNRGVPLYVAYLLVLAVNRFFLASLSTALPHVVTADKLVMANSVSPTIGGIMALIGGAAAAGLNALAGNSQGGAAVTMLAAGACYVIAGVIAATMRRDLLGPVREPGKQPGRLLGELTSVAAEIGAAARYVVARRQPAAALAATGASKFLFGILFVMSILLYRNYFYPGSAPAAEAHYTGLAALSGVGYACAALIVPPLARRLGTPAVISLSLALSAAAAAALGESFRQLPYLGVGFLLYLTGQSVAICATTVLQREVDDTYRGRIFAFYDVMFNVTLAAGALISAGFMPRTGRSPVLVAVVAAGYAVAAIGYWLASRSRQIPAAAGPSSPSRRAQASSS